jgi:hypothetical protein
MTNTRTRNKQILVISKEVHATSAFPTDLAITKQPENKKANTNVSTFIYAKYKRNYVTAWCKFIKNSIELRNTNV